VDRGIHLLSRQGAGVFRHDRRLGGIHHGWPGPRGRRADVSSEENDLEIGLVAPTLPPSAQSHLMH
jgi:hypothetical protein